MKHSPFLNKASPGSDRKELFRRLFSGLMVMSSFVFLFLILACERPPMPNQEIFAEDFIITIDENPGRGQLLGKLEAYSNFKTIYFQVVSHNKKEQTISQTMATKNRCFQSHLSFSLFKKFSQNF